MPRECSAIKRGEPITNWVPPRGLVPKGWRGHHQCVGFRFERHLRGHSDCTPHAHHQGHSDASTNHKTMAKAMESPYAPWPSSCTKRWSIRHMRVPKRALDAILKENTISKQTQHRSEDSPRIQQVPPRVASANPFRGIFGTQKGLGAAYELTDRGRTRNSGHAVRPAGARARLATVTRKTTWPTRREGWSPRPKSCLHAERVSCWCWVLAMACSVR